MQYTYATSAYYEARFLVHFYLAIRANFVQGDFGIGGVIFCRFCRTRDMTDLTWLESFVSFVSMPMSPPSHRLTHMWVCML